MLNHPLRPRERHTFHFDIGFPVAEGEIFHLHTGLGVVPVCPHTPETLARLKATNPVLAAMPEPALARVTHFVENVELPADVARVLRLTEAAPGPGGGLPTLVGSMVHVPAAALRRHRAKRIAAVRARRQHGPLERFGVAAPAFDTLSDDAVLDHLAFLDGIKYTPREAAVAVAFHHPQLGSRDPDTAAIVTDDYIRHSPKLDAFAADISTLGRSPTTGWCLTEKSTAPNGEILTWGSKWEGRAGKEVEQYNINPALVGTANTPPDMDTGIAVVSHSVRGSADDPELFNKSWTVNQGTGGVTSDAKATTSRIALRTSRPGTGGGAVTLTVNNKTPGYGVEVDAGSITYTPLNNGNALVTINVLNDFLRTLGCYAQFRDADGHPIANPSGWINQFPDGKFGQALLQPSKSKLFICGAEAVDTIMGIPVPPDPAMLDFIWPANAATCDLLLGGLGTRSWDNDVDWYGVLNTGMFQYAIPVLLLYAAAAVPNSGWYKRIMSDKAAKAAFYTLMGELFGGYVASKIATDNTKALLVLFGKMAAGLIVHKSLAAFANYIGNVLIDSELAGAIPFAGWAFHALCMAIDTAALAETTVEVLMSPATYDLTLTREMSARVTVSPDPTHGSNVGAPIWPTRATRYQCVLQVRNGTTYTVKGNLPKERDRPVVVNYDLLPTGGSFQVIFAVYSDNDWLAGKWEGPWTPAVPPGDNTPLSMSGSITEALAPLTASTQYVYKKKLGYDKTKNKHVWIEHEQPTALIHALSGAPDGHNLSQIPGITINNRAFMLGYTWQASGQSLRVAGSSTTTEGQIFAFQNIYALKDPETGLKFPSAGFSEQPYLAYDQFGSAPIFSLTDSYKTELVPGKVGATLARAFATAKYPLSDKATISDKGNQREWLVNDNGVDPTYDIIARSGGGYEVHLYSPGGIAQNNFFVDPQIPGMYHLRKVILDANTPFDVTSKISYGYFTLPKPTAVLIHPAGYAIAVNFNHDKVEIIKLPSNGAPDADAQPAVLAGGNGIRQGLLRGPRAATITPDGRILILESLNKRIQAYDINGNPAPSFIGLPVTELDAATFRPQLDKQQASMALRAAFAKAGVNLASHWQIFDGGNVIDIRGQDDGRLLLTLNGGSISNHWAIMGADKTYRAVLSIEQITVSSDDGHILCTLPVSVASSFDCGILPPEAATVLQAAGIALAQPITIIGDALTMHAAVADDLCAFTIPASVVEALAERDVTLSEAATVASIVTVTVEAVGGLWIVQDADSASSYRITGQAAAPRLLASNYSPFTPLTAVDNVSYLDMATEAKGYIYVLGYFGNGNELADYFVDIYEPTGAWMVRTPDPSKGLGATGVNGGRLAVDLWRNMYTLNFEYFLGPHERTEPSISLWEPSSPTG